MSICSTFHTSTCSTDNQAHCAWGRLPRKILRKQRFLNNPFLRLTDRILSEKFRFFCNISSLVHAWAFMSAATIGFFVEPVILPLVLHNSVIAFVRLGPLPNATSKLVTLSLQWPIKTIHWKSSTVNCYSSGLPYFHYQKREHLSMATARCLNILENACP